MTSRGVGFLRDNALLVAAAALPVVVVVFFVLAAAIPRWTVPPPAYDLLFRAEGIYDRSGPRVQIAYEVRDGQVTATVRALPDDSYLPPPALFLFDHSTMSVREIRVELPDVRQGDAARTVIVEALAGRRVEPQPMSPDGYVLEDRRSRAPGLIGEIFGMGRDESAASLVNNGRVIPLTLPSGYRYVSGVYAVGWILDDERK
jgi:hypothetical protein